uniref:Uncharacterized protein n=1 Tax=Junco hyemalis TaxID=40217 RepID=A0A8C5J0R6_JUNHY
MALSQSAGCSERERLLHLLQLRFLPHTGSGARGYFPTFASTKDEVCLAPGPCKEPTAPVGSCRTHMRTSYARNRFCLW